MLDLPGNPAPIHTIVLWACVVIAIAVFATMLWSVARFRPVASDCPAARGRKNRVEVVWAIMPILIVIATAAPAIRVLLSVGNTEVPVAGTSPHRGPALVSETPQQAIPEKTTFADKTFLEDVGPL
jgi:heme/copper-type cytochrome/quinol oxidase subunit 2